MIDRILGKIPTIFERDWTALGRPVIDRVVAGCEWVLIGEGEATRKWDGTPIAIIGHVAYKRLDNKPGRTMPEAWIAAQPDPDPITGEQPGWVPLDSQRTDDRLILATIQEGPHYPDGTYEFCGPKVNGNPEQLGTHKLILHGAYPLHDVPRSFTELRDYLVSNIEGIVFYHPDGRMAKIKGRDFGIKRQGV
jgi:hypothetical protein